MTDNRTTELLREELTERGIKWRSGLKGVTFVGDWCFVEYENGKLAATCEPTLTPEQAIAATLGSDTKGCENLLWELVGALDVADAADVSKKPIVAEYARRIAATLGGNENRISERLRGIAADMRDIGASSMTPRELFAYWAVEVDKAADLADFMCGVNPDGLPYGLTLSDDGDLLNWRGENYVRQDALGSGTCKNVSYPPSGFLCSECGWGDFAEPSHLLTTAKFTGRDKGPNFCPNCGKAVER